MTEPVLPAESVVWFRCPECGVFVSHFRDRYVCPRCGDAWVWDEDAVEWIPTTMNPTDDAGEALLPDEVVTPAPRKQVDEDTLAEVEAVQHADTVRCTCAWRTNRFGFRVRLSYPDCPLHGKESDGEADGDTVREFSVRVYAEQVHEVTVYATDRNQAESIIWDQIGENGEDVDDLSEPIDWKVEVVATPLSTLLQREQELFDAEDDDEVAAAVWVPNRTHIDR